jgi:hypothetical protein
MIVGIKKTDFKIGQGEIFTKDISPLKSQSQLGVMAQAKVLFFCN